MKQLFKTTLLAAAVAATCGTAVAGIAQVDTQYHSLEGVVGYTGVATSDAITYELRAAYQEGDKITLTFPEGTLSLAAVDAFPNSLEVAPVAGSEGHAGLTIGKLNSGYDVAGEKDFVTYRVTNIQPSSDDIGSTVGAVIGSGDDKFNISYDAAKLLSDVVTVAFSSETAVGDVLDAGGTLTATIAEAKTQFAATATATAKFANVIDVANARMTFANDNMGNAVTTDAFEFSINNPDSSGFLNAVKSATLNVNVFGEAGKMDGLAATDFTSSGTEAFTEESAKLALSFAAAGTNDLAEMVTFVNPTDVVLEPQSFAGDFTYEYVSAADVTKTVNLNTGLALGEWTLNGANVNVPYMPYGDNISQILYVTNTGVQTGDISVEAFDSEGNPYDLGVVATAAAGAVTKITVPVNQGLALQGMTNGKVSLNVTVNAPSADITVYSAYTVGTVRGYVNTDQYKGK